MHLILIIDTDINELSALEYYLSGLRYRVVGTARAKKGLEFALSAPPDLLIIGLTLKDKESIENLALIKKDAITKDTPVLGIYSENNPYFIEKMKTLGVTSYLIQPVDKYTLIEKVKSILEATKIKKDREIQERVRHIEIVQEVLGRTTIQFYSGISKYVAHEIRHVFTRDFLASIANDIVTIDIRFIPSLDIEDLNILEKILLLFGDKKINILTGRHLGIILSETELGEKANLFMSKEELEEFLKISQN